MLSILIRRLNTIEIFLGVLRLGKAKLLYKIVETIFSKNNQDTTVFFPYQIELNWKIKMVFGKYIIGL